MKLPIILLCGNAGVGKDTVGQMIVDRWNFTKFSQADTIKEIARDSFGFTDEQLWGPSENRNAVDTRFAPGALRYREAFRTISANHGVSRVTADFVKHCSQTTGGSGDLYALVETFMKAMEAFADSKGGLTPRIVLQMLGTEVGRAYNQDIWLQAALQKAERALLTGAPGVVVADGRFRNEIMGFRRFGGYAIKINGGTSLPADAHPSEVEVTKIPPQFYDAVLQNNKEHGLDGLRYAVGEMMAGLLTPRYTQTY